MNWLQKVALVFMIALFGGLIVATYPGFHQPRAEYKCHNPALTPREAHHSISCE